MDEIKEYPQDAAPTKNRRPLKIALATIGAAVVLVAGTWGTVAYASGVNAHNQHVQAVALQQQVEQAKPALEAQTQAIADESDTTTADAVVQAEQAREAAVVLAAQQAAAEAAAQAAAQAAKPKATQSDGGLLPAGARVPNIPGTDSPDTTACASGSASTVNGAAVCD